MTVAPAGLVAGTVRSAGTVMAGGEISFTLSSFTVTVNEVSLKLPLVSLAVQTTVVEPIGKTLRSAVANAQVKAQDGGQVLDVDDLVVREVFVNEGPTLKRWRAAAMGRAAPIRKRTSHITVVVESKEA